MNREAMLAQLNTINLWDVVIIGGGATGLGCAADAASRGYKTLLVEACDFGKGTSGKSTKLVHGGVRYLAQGNIKLVMEALRERALLLKNAPHITTASGFVIPVFSWFDKIFYGIGLKMYALLAGKLSLGKTRILNKHQTLERLPTLNPAKLKGGILYYDGQFDDTRLSVDLAATAASYGGVILNYCKAISFTKTNHKITGLTIHDSIKNHEYNINTKAVINATGVFTDAVLKMDKPGSADMIAPSQGIHLVVEKKFFPASDALMIPKTEDGRVLFAVPWHQHVVLGTTDTLVASVNIEPKPLEEEIEFVLHHANKYLSQTITRSDVKSMFAGLRPLIKKEGSNKTAALSRDFLITVSESGLLTITGGKWTTYRKMAEDAVSKAAAFAGLEKKDCITAQLAIHNTAKNITAQLGLQQQQFIYNEELVQHFIQNEMAQTVEDILARRTRLLFLDAHAAIDAAPGVAKQMAVIINKDEQWINAQVDAFITLAKQYCLQ